MTTLLHSLREGGSGGGVICANFYPHIVAWICANFDTAPVALVERVHAFLAVADAALKTSYPASAKTYVSELLGLDITNKTRQGSYAEGDLATVASFPPAGFAPGDELRLRLAGVKFMADAISAECGIAAQTF